MTQSNVESIEISWRHLLQYKKSKFILVFILKTHRYGHPKIRSNIIKTMCELSPSFSGEFLTIRCNSPSLDRNFPMRFVTFFCVFWEGKKGKLKMKKTLWRIKIQKTGRKKRFRVYPLNSLYLIMRFFYMIS